MREFRNLMENDESKTLKYQMCYISKFWNDNLRTMEQNCLDFDQKMNDAEQLHQNGKAVEVHLATDED